MDDPQSRRPMPHSAMPHKNQVVVSQPHSPTPAGEVYRTTSVASSDTSSQSENGDLDLGPLPASFHQTRAASAMSPSNESLQSTKRPLRRDTTLTFRLPRQRSEVVAAMSTRTVLWPDTLPQPPIVLVEGCLPPDSWPVRSARC
eukprot:GGOE01005808.1.p1 GENE.GGOE01005808.1~~GGOE01005808.1.p1  ORF type:complete len:162 (+),score=34.39 GGOE01005808.1:57-488(+)